MSRLYVQVLLAFDLSPSGGSWGCVVPSFTLFLCGGLVQNSPVWKSEGSEGAVKTQAFRASPAPGGGAPGRSDAKNSRETATKWWKTMGFWGQNVW